jgi:exopolyphosphatase/guanosine-5'-triphosphate,3'-diphosphate pyrophosphatase
MAKRTAVIDIGSNSARMVIFEKTSRFAFHLLHETKSRVRISEGAYENGGLLNDAAIDRTFKAVDNFLSIAESYHVRKILCVATSAVRDAPNKKQFLHRLRKEFGLNVKVIDGTKEAYLGGIACANLLAKTEAMTIDIGGGSTECAYIEDGYVKESISLDLGTVRLKELYFDHNDISAAQKHIDKAIDRLPLAQNLHVVGIGGTFRALSQAIMQNNNYPLDKLHGFTFSSEDLFTLGDKILNADKKELKLLGIKKERFDVIKPGTLILMKILKRIGCRSLTTSGAGVREGVYLHDLLRNSGDRFPEHFNPSVRYLIDRHTLNKKEANQLSRISKELFDLVHTLLDIDPHFRRELSIAAKLAHIGESLHFYSYHQHSYYLTQTALEYGFTHQQITLISTLVRFHKRKQPKKSHLETYASLLPDEKTVVALSHILSLANALTVHRPRNIDFTLSFEKDAIVVEALKKPLYLAQEIIKNLDLPKELSVRFA